MTDGFDLSPERKALIDRSPSRENLTDTKSIAKGGKKKGGGKWDVRERKQDSQKEKRQKEMVENKRKEKLDTEEKDC